MEAAEEVEAVVAAEAVEAADDDDIDGELQGFRADIFQGSIL
jgi:hypothetical protein